MTDTHIQLAIGLCVAFVGVVVLCVQAARAWDVNERIRREPMDDDFDDGDDTEIGGEA